MYTLSIHGLTLMSCPKLHFGKLISVFSRDQSYEALLNCLWSVFTITAFFVVSKEHHLWAFNWLLLQRRSRTLQCHLFLKSFIYMSLGISLLCYVIKFLRTMWCRLFCYYKTKRVPSVPNWSTDLAIRII